MEIGRQTEKRLHVMLTITFSTFWENAFTATQIVIYCKPTKETKNVQKSNNRQCCKIEKKILKVPIHFLNENDFILKWLSKFVTLQFFLVVMKFLKLATLTDQIPSIVLYVKMQQQVVCKMAFPLEPITFLLTFIAFGNQLDSLFFIWNEMDRNIFVVSPSLSEFLHKRQDMKQASTALKRCRMCKCFYY